MTVDEFLDFLNAHEATRGLGRELAAAVALRPGGWAALTAGRQGSAGAVDAGACRPAGGQGAAPSGAEHDAGEDDHRHSLVSARRG